MTKYRECPKCHNTIFREGNKRDYYYELTCTNCSTVMAISVKIVEKVEIIKIGE